jgi:hypothetical protein
MKDGRKGRDAHDEQTPRLPTAGEYVRMVGRLVDVVDSAPSPPPPKDWIFECVAARVELRRHDRVLETFGTFNDFYFGEFGAVRSAFEEARGVVARERILKSSEVEVVVVKITSQTSQRPEEHRVEPWCYDRQFRSFDRGGRAHNLPEPVEVDVWNSRVGILADAPDGCPVCPSCGDSMIQCEVTPAGWSWVCHERKCFGEGQRAEWRKETA